MAVIDVRPVKGAPLPTFDVTIREGGSSSSYRVTAEAEYLGRIAPGRAAAEIVDAAFRFLLDREPKESILRSFDVTVIGRYFPEFERSIGAYLAVGR